MNRICKITSSSCLLDDILPSDDQTHVTHRYHVYLIIYCVSVMEDKDDETMEGGG